MRNPSFVIPLALLFGFGLAGCEENGVEEDQAVYEEDQEVGAERETEVAAVDEQREPAPAAGGEFGTAADEGVELAVEESPEYGEYIADDEGRAVYIYQADSQGQSNCTGQCAEMWPPVTAEEGEASVADPALEENMLGTIEREDGTQQVTYNGRPLYYYQQDNADAANGQGLNGEWFLITAQGEPVAGQTNASAQM